MTFFSSSSSYGSFILGGSGALVRIFFISIFFLLNIFLIFGVHNFYEFIAFYTNIIINHKLWHLSIILFFFRVIIFFIVLLLYKTSASSKVLLTLIYDVYDNNNNNLSRNNFRSYRYIIIVSQVCHNPLIIFSSVR